MYLLNGESKQTIAFSDRGFQYGDGLFETIEVVNGHPVFLNLHLQRINKGCKQLLIPAPDLSLLKQEAFNLAQQSYLAPPHSKQSVLKLIITRGSGGRGYSQPETIKPTRLFSLHPYPEYSDDFNLNGIKARICSSRLSINPTLAGIKHMNRLEQILARSEWNNRDIQEGLMLDRNDHVVEGTMSNLFLFKQDILYTPVIDDCGIEGIVRNILIDLAKKNQMKVIEKKISVEEVKTADEVFLTNSIIGIWPIKLLENQRYKMGSGSKKLSSLFFAYKQENINDR